MSKRKVENATPTAQPTAQPDPATTALAKLHTDSNPVLAEARSLPISAATVDRAAGILLQLAGAKRALAAQRDFFVKPLKAHIKAIELKFKPLAQALDEADGALRGRVVTYRESERVKAEQARAALVAEAARLAEEADRKRAAASATKGKRANELNAQADAAAVAASTSALAAVGVAAPTKTMVAGAGATVGTVTGVLRWDFEVVDAESVPRQYLIVDGTLVRRAIKSGLREISGIRIFQKEGLAVGVVDDGESP